MIQYKLRLVKSGSCRYFSVNKLKLAAERKEVDASVGDDSSGIVLDAWN